MTRHRGRPAINESPSCHGDRKYYAKDLCKKCYHNTYGKIYYKRRLLTGTHKVSPSIIQDARSYRLKYPMRVWLSEIKSRYGLTFRDYIHLLEEQSGLCAICSSSGFVGHNKRVPFTIDHDHVTNKVRGLLCSLCNTGLGALKDSFELLEQASAYLKMPPMQKLSNDSWN